MLRNISKTVGSAMAALCLVSTLAMAGSQKQNPTMSQKQTQNPPQTMTCTQDDRMGNCTAAQGPDGKNLVVVGTGLKIGDAMTCVDLKGGTVQCKPVS